MKLTLQTQLLPTPEQIEALEATLRAFNAAADWLAGEAFARRTANKIALQKLYYADLRSRFGLSAQMAVRCIAQVCEAYKRDKSIRPQFQPFAAMPFDQRLMSFKGPDRVSLLTLSGRIILPFIMGQYQQTRFKAAKGQSDLVRRQDGRWFLLVTVDLPDGTPLPSTDFIGVDLGVTNLATDSDGERHSGAEVEACRRHYHDQRRSLQQAAARRQRRGRRPKNIRRKLKSFAGREARFRKDVNHHLSKTLVAKAKDTERGIALENLKGIRDRTRFRKPQRAKMGGWAFFQLRQFITYKAKLAGVDVVIVDPRHTSRTCPVCGSVEKANRPSQSEFRCVACGHTDHADVNAARNIRSRAKALVNAA
ncbi:IS200/IS605 family element transposase accessory protein TnpB [Allochromatium humboldtianum]|uniref:IS200/IS605 family element transposase accessory protein TnpB n=1 Tax=Allochromatium humboldtianum TaxID=504901 RepID=A0A850RK84_9GAMM|nr:RNA-guided endonuclease TnpB family protein [Allochromatium humboldtianum]NVZ09413.1 IS200/IS605 family element transposase accessory protein TnpB [Allochromatium humboldtianum]